MPRKPLASLYPSFAPGKRPPPPDTLRPDMQEQWRQIVGRMPANWFTLEATHCRRLFRPRRIASVLRSPDRH
jgi:hypothetical protein